MLVSRLENLVSDRRLSEHCSLRLDILYFLGYEVDKDLPWHSTISRTRQLYPATRRTTAPPTPMPASPLSPARYGP